MINESGNMGKIDIHVRQDTNDRFQRDNLKKKPIQMQIQMSSKEKRSITIDDHWAIKPLT